MPLHAWTSARYVVPLPPGHRFPIEKYERLRQRVLAESLVLPSHLHEPRRVPLAMLRLVHTPDYIDRLTSGTLTDAEVRRLGFPWSPDLVERSFRAVGGTCEAVAHALDAGGVAINLAGTRRAFRHPGEGFCVSGDVAIALQHALDQAWPRRDHRPRCASGQRDARHVRRRPARRHLHA